MRSLMKKRLMLALGLVFLFSFVSKSSLAAENLLRNPGFEDEQKKNLAPYWGVYGKKTEPYTVDKEEKHSGKQSIKFAHSTELGARGAAASVVLNQKEPAPLHLSGWSKAREVVKGQRGLYEIIVNFVYTDGKVEYSRMRVKFNSDTHDWQYVECRVTPKKPVKRVSLFIIFQNCSGTAWFDDICFRKASETVEVQKIIKKETMLLAAAGKRVAPKKIDTNNAVRVNSPDIFWLKRPLRVPADSMQYINLPIPGGKGLDQVRNLKYVLDLPKGFELVRGLNLIGKSCFGDLYPVYPYSVKTIESDKNFTRYEFDIAGLGCTGVRVWLSSPYVPVISITGTGGQWQDFHGEAPGYDSTKAVWLLRWANITKNIQSCCGVVDVDDIVVRRKSTGKIVFEEHFNDVSFGQFKGGRKNGVSLEKENDNYFVRIRTGDAEAKIQQSIRANLSAPEIQSLIFGKDYEVTCRARSVITRTPDYLCQMPVWIKIDGLKRETEIRAHYEYDIGEKHYSVQEQTLRVIVENKDVRKPKALEVVLWSAAEDCMEWQQNQVQDYLLDITKSCGIKTHLTELNLNPWKSPYYGKVNKMDLRDPLAEKIKQRGMDAIPYIAFPYRSWSDGMGFKSYVSKHPPSPGKLAINESVNQFGQTKRATGIRNPSPCPTRLTGGEYWPVILKFLKEAARVNKWDGLMWDYEVANILCVPPQRESCFCPECIEAFKQYTGIKDITKAPENRVMLEKDYPFQDLAEPARSILSNYPLEWLKFRGDQNGRMWHSMIKAVREVNPSARFYLYSGSYRSIPTAEAPWHDCEYYGVYPPAAGRYVDVFMEHHYPMRGKRGLKEIKLMREALRAGGGKKVKKVLNTMQTWSPRYPLAKNDAIQSVALTESDGFQIYSWGGNFDSQTWSSVREGIMALTAFEDFFLEGTRFDQAATLDKPLDYSVWIKGEDRVVFIFNNTAKDKKITLKNDFRVKYASNRVTAKNYFTGEIYADPEIITCIAQAYDTTIIHFRAR